MSNMSKRESLVVGIISAPEKTADITEMIIYTLADKLAKQIDNKIDWVVEQLVDPLTSYAESAQHMRSNAKKIKSNKEWHYAICLTDLPIFHNKDVVASDIHFNERIAQISLPAFGWLHKRKRIERTMIHLLSKLHNFGKTDCPVTSKEPKGRSAFNKCRNHFPIRSIHLSKNDSLSPHSNLNDYREKHVRTSYNNRVDDRYIVSPRFFGLFKLVIGMTFANNPMKIMTSFKNVIAIAFTTGAFALIFPIIWKLGHTFSAFRLSGMMLAAIFGLIAWIIAAHHLWEPTAKQNKLKVRMLYNLATISTLIIDVVTYYLFMFTLFLTTCLILIPVDYFQSMINDYDDMGPTFVNYVRVAWVTTSISTIVSAIGAGLENEKLIRDITYGYRQRRRNKKHKSSYR